MSTKRVEDYNDDLIEIIDHKSRDNSTSFLTIRSREYHPGTKVPLFSGTFQGPRFEGNTDKLTLWVEQARKHVQRAKSPWKGFANNLTEVKKRETSTLINPYPAPEEALWMMPLRGIGGTAPVLDEIRRKGSKVFIAFPTYHGGQADLPTRFPYIRDPISFKFPRFQLKHGGMLLLPKRRDMEWRECSSNCVS